MTRAPDWLRERRNACEARFSFLTEEFGYRQCVRRFQHGGFQVGYRGPVVGS